MQPDFSLIYSELGLRPDCSLAEFKRAYLRRIGDLHPDRNGGAPATSDAQAVLTDLIAAYVAVCRFQRRYGRMPGAGRGGSCPVASSGDGAAAVGAPPTRDGHQRMAQAAMGNAAISNAAMSSTAMTHVAVTQSASNAAAPSRPTRRLLVVFLALIALLVSWDWLTL